MLQHFINRVIKWRENSRETEYGPNLEFRNRTKEKLDQDIKYDLDGLLETDIGIHPELVNEFPVVLLKEDNPDPVAALETKILDPNTITAAAAAAAAANIVLQIL